MMMGMRIPRNPAPSGDDDDAPYGHPARVELSGVEALVVGQFETETTGVLCF
jgi:hypothetical protein